METTTGMSAPPIAITMCTPKRRAITLIATSGVMPCWMSGARRNRDPNQITPTSPARFSQWRAGSSRGLPLIRAESLPNAITDPDSVTAPISTPT